MLTDQEIDRKIAAMPQSAQKRLHDRAKAIAETNDKDTFWWAGNEALQDAAIRQEQRELWRGMQGK